MILYTILITNSLCSKENSNSAFLFCKNLLQCKKFNINNIFFYGDGVLNGNKFIRLLKNEFNLSYNWYKLSKEFSVNLYLCYTSSQQRGIISNVMAKELNYEHGNLCHGFQITGLSTLIYSIFHSDRLLQF